MKLFNWYYHNNLKANLVYSIVLVIFLLVSLFKYETLAATPEVYQIINKMPESIQSIIGFQPGLNLSKYLDYTIMIYYYLSMVMAINYISKGSMLNKSNNESSFIAILPIKQIDNIISKYLCDVVMILQTSLILLITNLIIINLNNFEVSINKIIIINFYFFINTIFLYNIGIIINNKGRSLSLFALSLILLMASYIFRLPILNIIIINQYFTLNSSYILIKALIFIICLYFMKRSITYHLKDDIIN